MLKLNLACGSRVHEGYINIDIRPGHGNLTHDISKPLPFEDNSVSEVLIESAFEHLFLTQQEPALKDWYLKLKKDGILKIYWLPNIEKAVAEYQKGFLPFNNLYGAIMGAPAGEDYIQLHKCIFTEKSITNLLKKVGFKNIIIEYKNKFPDTKWLYSMCVECIK